MLRMVTGGVGYLNVRTKPGYGDRLLVFDSTVSLTKMTVTFGYENITKYFSEPPTTHSN